MSDRWFKVLNFTGKPILGIEPEDLIPEFLIPATDEFIFNINNQCKLVKTDCIDFLPRNAVVKTRKERLSPGIIGLPEYTYGVFLLVSMDIFRAAHRLDVWGVDDTSGELILHRYSNGLIC